MDRDKCLAALVNIQATLELLAKTAPTCWQSGRWQSGQRCPRWMSPTGDPYDFELTLADCFRDNDLRRVLRWIEFHVDGGPIRRKRLAEVLRSLRDQVGCIERGAPSDPFLWMRESIDAAAAGVVGEMQHVMDYLGELITLVDNSSTDSPDDYFVTMLQMAAVVGGSSKRTIRRLYDGGQLPAPDVVGHRGKAHQWRWSIVRPILEERFSRTLPAKYPADRFVRSG